MYLYINTASPQGRSRLFGRRVRCPVPAPPRERRFRAAWGKTAFRTDGINGVHIVFHAGLSISSGLSVPPRLSGPGFLFHLVVCSVPAVWSGLSVPSGFLFRHRNFFAGCRPVVSAVRNEASPSARSAGLGMPEGAGNPLAPGFFLGSASRKPASRKSPSGRHGAFAARRPGRRSEASSARLRGVSVTPPRCPVP